MKDLHSGVFGGTVSEGMADLMWMMNQLVDVEGNILVEGLMDRFKIRFSNFSVIKLFFPLRKFSIFILNLESIKHEMLHQFGIKENLNS